MALDIDKQYILCGQYYCQFIGLVVVPVARFDSRVDAISYVTDSILKNPTPTYKYKASSLLREYTAYEIKEPEADIPSNPKLGN